MVEWLKAVALEVARWERFTCKVQTGSAICPVRLPEGTNIAWVSLMETSGVDWHGANKVRGLSECIESNGCKMLVVSGLTEGVLGYMLWSRQVVTIFLF